MASSLNTPDALTQPIAENGDKNTIPATNDQSLGQMSQSTGFPEICSERIADGGKAPRRADFNGAFNMLSRYMFFKQNGGIETFRADVSTAIGGYPKDAILGYRTSTEFKLVRSLVANNTYNFNTTPSYIDDGTHWESVIPMSKNISNWSSNVSNCITEIPQDINLELNNGTLTLKAGSKVYVPNGAGVFDVRNITSDATLTDASGANNVWLVAVSANGTLLYRALANCTSGANATASSGFAYDTTANDIGWFTSGGTKSYSNVSFPICICSSSSSGFTSIDQVFNGIGYIGSTTFILPGVKGLIPNGFNSDGTLKNTVFNTTQVLTRAITINSCLFVTTTGLFNRTKFYTVKTKADMVAINLDGLYYVEDENLCYSWAGYGATNFYTGFCLVGFCTFYNGQITSFTQRTVFHAVDYNDVAKVGFTGSYNDLTSRPTDLFDTKWSDHLLDNTSWLRADNFSWSSGVTYSVAYNHLVADIAGKTLQSETISGTTVQFYLANDGHKICPASQESNVLAIYNATGVAWYYIIDSANTRFKLPRTKFGITGFRDTVGKYVEAGLPNITGSAEAYWESQNATVGAFYADTSRNNSERNNNTGFPNLGFDASRSSSIYGNSTTVQPPATQMYLYFYVGTFTQTAIENTAGLNASLFNDKADVNLLNTANNVDFVIESQLPTAENDYTWYRKYKSGWVEQGGYLPATGSGDTLQTVNLPKAMNDAHYTVTTSLTDTTAGYAPNWGLITVQQQTTTGFKTYAGSDWGKYWQVSGKAA